MSEEPTTFLKALGDFLLRIGGAVAHHGARGARLAAAGLVRARVVMIICAALGLAGYLLWKYAPVQSVDRGEIAVRSDLKTGRISVFNAGSFWAVPHLQEVRRLSTRDQVYRPERSAKANGEAPFQSVEGLSLGVDLSVRYAIDPTRVASFSKSLPDDISGELVDPAVRPERAGDFLPVDIRNGHVERSHADAGESIQHVRCFLVDHHAPPVFLLSSSSMYFKSSERQHTISQ